MSILDPVQLLNACRLCLSCGSNNINLFSEEGRNKSYQIKIWKHFSLWVCFEDSLPKTICQLCCTLLDKYHTFVLKVEEVQKDINEMVPSRNNDENNPVACETHPTCRRDPHFQLCNLSKIDLNKSVNNADNYNYQHNEPIDTTDNNANTFSKHPSQKVKFLIPSYTKKRCFLTKGTETGNICNNEQNIDNIKVEGPHQIESYVMNCDPTLAQAFSGDVNCESSELVSVRLNRSADCKTSAGISNVCISGSPNEGINYKINVKNVTSICQLKNNSDGRVDNSHKLKEKDIGINENGDCELVSTKFQNDARNVFSCSESENGGIEDGDENRNDSGCNVSEDEDESWEQPESILCNRSNELPLNIQLAAFYKYNCKICEPNTTTFSSFFLLSKHYRLKHNARGYVMCCGRKLLSKPLLVSHMQKHVQPGIFKCRQCGRELANELTYEKHMIQHLPEHKRPFKCEHCIRGFASKGELQSHERVHLPEDKRLTYVCDTCGKKFGNPANLVSHQRYVHEKIRQAMCHICPKTFANRSALKEHLYSHGANSERIQCHVCGKGLKNKCTLRFHMKSHGSELYGCPHCDKVYNFPQSLRDHLRSHSDVRPHQCAVCCKTFKRKQGLKTHTVQHTGEKPYQCPHCPRVFASSGNYYAHKKRMHAREREGLIT